MSLANVIALYMFYKEHLSSSKPYLKKNFQEILNFLSKLSALQMFISVHRLESPDRQGRISNIGKLGTCLGWQFNRGGTQNIRN